MIGKGGIKRQNSITPDPKAPKGVAKAPKLQGEVREEIGKESAEEVFSTPTGMIKGKDRVKSNIFGVEKEGGKV